jgi:hypothetical protein
MVNAALSGRIDGGLSSGLTVLAGPSKHFKTSFALLMAAAYLKQHPDAIMLFYDSEFGSPQSYFESFNIDTNRVLHTPITDVEKLKFDLVNQLESIERGDKVVVVIDSIGNLASKKELEDAINEKSVADMTRAKALKGLFRMVTPYLSMKNIPLLAVNHTYQEIGLFPKAIVSGGTGIMYSADNVWILGRQQDKQRSRAITLSLTSKSHASLRRSHAFRSRYHGKVVSRSTLALLRSHCCRVTSLSRARVGTVESTQKLVKRFNPRFVRRIH